jgi:hypothetical protein
MSNNLNLSHADADVIREALSNIPAIKFLAVNFSEGITPTVSARVSFTPRENWSNGIFLNSAHRTFMLHNDGELKSLTGYKLGKFRACQVKNSKEAAAKLVKWATEKALAV